MCSAPAASLYYSFMCCLTLGPLAISCVWLQVLVCDCCLVISISPAVCELVLALLGTAVSDWHPQAPILLSLAHLSEQGILMCDLTRWELADVHLVSTLLGYTEARLGTWQKCGCAGGCVRNMNVWMTFSMCQECIDGVSGTRMYRSCVRNTVEQMSCQEQGCPYGMPGA